MIRLVFILSLLLAGGGVFRPVALDAAEASTMPARSLMDIEGNWFSCEYAHSQIPPEDGCQMFDDDGFIVSNGKIDHVKVTNSRQLNCRHDRKGQCFDRGKKKLVVKRDSVGDIKATAQGFAITYWGCTQDYAMQARGRYFEVGPIGERCLWSREKRYFIARYQGQILSTENKNNLKKSDR